MPDDAWLRDWMSSAWWRWRSWHLLRCLVIGVGVASFMRALLASVVANPLAVGAGVGAVVALGLLALTRGARDVTVMVQAVEQARPDLRNALFTWHEGHALLSPAIAGRLARHARESLEPTTWLRPGSRATWAIALAVLLVGASANLLLPLSSRPAPGGVASADAVADGDTPVALQWQIVVTPPAYARRPLARLGHVDKIDALAGSRVDVSFTGWRSGARARLGETVIPVAGTSASAVVSLVASASDVLLVEDEAGTIRATLTLVVVPDAAPAVRITAPAADLRRAEPVGAVSIAVVGRDDLGLRDLRLRFTKVSGSGESFTFEDGEWPLRIGKTSSTEWTGSFTLDLATAGLGPGDSIAYHAVAHDARVGPEGAAESERFLIEITRPGALAAGDFSLPEPEDRFALSQRMVIQLTERLLEQRPRMTADAFAQEAQTLAMAQRRVKAEFIFMLGGEVEDEFEEAAHSHEVEAGRLDNQGQGELMDAVRQMSLAETRLTGGSVREALTYEYKALAALQAAFGKARYFMRTLPTPIQIDAGRRLQGDRSTAASSRWPSSPVPDATRTEAMALLAEIETRGVSLLPLLPRLVALDRGNGDWVARVQRAGSTGDTTDIAHALRTRLMSGSASWMAMPLPRSREESSLATSGARRP